MSLIYTSNYISINFFSFEVYMLYSQSCLLNIDLNMFLGLSFASLLFILGVFGILRNQKNIIIIILCVELMLFGAGLLFLFYAVFFNYGLGQIYALLILTVATAETAIGLGIIVIAYRLNQSISFEAFTTLRG